MWRNGHLIHDLSPQGLVLAPYRGTPCPTMPLQPPKTRGDCKLTTVFETQKRSQAGNQAHGGETPASTVYRPKGVHGNQGFTGFDWGRTHLGGKPLSTQACT